MGGSSKVVHYAESETSDDTIGKITTIKKSALRILYSLPIILIHFRS